MRAKRLGRTQNSRFLNQQISRLRELDNITNLMFLAGDYLTLAAIAAATLGFYFARDSWGLAWAWNIPVTGLAILLVGAVQHRLAGLAHEAAHYALLRNRLANDLISDLFCMFPIYATTHQYRLVHLGHHQYTNDWQRDPDLLNIGKSKLMHRFPMSRWQFIYNYYLRFFMPHVLLRYLWDIVYLSAFGKGLSPLQQEEASHDQANALNMNLRVTSVLGLVYFFGMAFLLNYLNKIDAGLWLVLTPTLGWLAAVAITAALPDSAFFQSQLKSVYSTRFTNILKLTYYTAFLAFFAGLKYFTGINWGPYFLLLWVVPLVTSFAYFMLLRDVYQHANADDGKLTNTRVFFTDPLTLWSVFVYGQDMHVPHHMYPAIPHYNLYRLHRLLQEHNPEYSQNVVECHGTFHNTLGKPTIIDVMQTPTSEDGTISLPPDVRLDHGIGREAPKHSLQKQLVSDSKDLVGSVGE
jgi:fatty acid desaturase